MKQNVFMEKIINTNRQPVRDLAEKLSYEVICCDLFSIPIKLTVSAKTRSQRRSAMRKLGKKGYTCKRGKNIVRVIPLKYICKELKTDMDQKTSSPELVFLFYPYFKLLEFLYSIITLHNSHTHYFVLQTLPLAFLLPVLGVSFFQIAGPHSCCAGSRAF